MVRACVSATVCRKVLFLKQCHILDFVDSFFSKQETSFIVVSHGMNSTTKTAHLFQKDCVYDPVG